VRSRTTALVSCHGILSLFACFQLGIPCGYAQEHTGDEITTTPIIVSASRIETHEANVASSVSTVTEEEIDDGQYRNVTNAIEPVPGLEIVQSGGIGGNAVAFIRGANSEHTLVLLDGIELNNPASPNRAFNLTNLTLENIEKIEVLRGPQSSLYGSDAMGGVMNIISKKADKGLKMTVQSEGGSYNSFTQVGNLSYGSDWIEVSNGVTRQDIGNISAANSRDGNFEHDGYENTSLSNRVKLTPSEVFDANLTTRYDRSNAALDNTGGVGGDDPNRRFNNEEFFVRGEAKGHLLDKTLTPALSIAYSHHDLRDSNDPDSSVNEFLRSNYKGDLLKLQGVTNWSPTRYLSGVLGAETERERADSYYRSDGAYGPFEDNMQGADARTNALFSEARISRNKTVYLDLGGRLDDHSRFGTYKTWRVAPAYLLNDATKLRGSVGTGFKAPSLVQLYSSYGNSDLRPEENVGWDVGIDRKLIKDRLSASASYYHNHFDNLISFDPNTYILNNIRNAETSGCEISTDLTFTNDLSVRAAYTYTDSQDDDTGEALLRRPKNKATVTLVYLPTSRVKTQLQWRAHSNRSDMDYSAPNGPERITLGGYATVNFTASYQLSETVELFSRIDNLFDKEYEEVYGFGTMGAAAYGGVKLTL
jgi:vitamin B12 transporter